MTDLPQLAKPFTGKYVKTKPNASGASYVEHSDITQRLLQVVGPYRYELVQVIRGHVPEKTNRKNEVMAALADAVTGGVWRLTCTIDGREAVIEEVGEVEHPHNHDTDGSRLKFAASDAFKRCAMRVGLGLHLWCDDHYFLDKALAPAEVDA